MLLEISAAFTAAVATTTTTTTTMTATTTRYICDVGAMPVRAILGNGYPTYLDLELYDCCVLAKMRGFVLIFIREIQKWTLSLFCKGVSGSYMG